MEATDEVTITLTIEECARVEAALTALVSIATMAAGKGLPSALGLEQGGAIAAVNRALPKFQAALPEGWMDDSSPTEYAHVAQDQKTYQEAETFSVKVDDLRSLSSEEAGVIFGTEYDDSIRALLGTLTEYAGYTHKEFHELLDAMRDLLQATSPPPKGITVQESYPWVAVSDLTTLGALAHVAYQRRDVIEASVNDSGKPF